MEKPNLFKKQLEQYQAQAELKEKIIDIQFAPKIKAENDALKIQEQNLQKVNDEIEKITDSQIKPIQAVIDANNFALESISLQEDAINEKYDKQIESLDKIATINQDIANIQKQRMSIADALTRGDISAAAQLAQEARAESAASIVTGQKEALASNRNAQIKMLKRVEIEKQNKILQLEISTIENGSLLTLQKKKDTIESTINSINRNIQALNSEVEALKNAALYGGKTRAEIDALAELIAAAEKAGIPFNDLLLSQAGNAESLAKALWDAVNAQKALASLTGLVSGAEGGPAGTDGKPGAGTDGEPGAGTDGEPGAGTKGKSSGGTSTTAGNPPGSTGGNTFTTPMTISGQSIIPSKSGSTGTTLASSFSSGSLISKGVSAVGNAVKNLATTAVSKATTAVKNVATSIASTAKQVISNPISSLKNAAVSVAKSVAAPILGPIKAVSNVASGVKKLFGFSQGGLVPRYMANGGAVGSDTVPAMLTPGEFVVNKAATKAYRPLLERINESKYPGMLGSSGMNQVPVNNISTSMNDNSTAVYNYNLRFNINGANANAKDIANTVMREIKNVDSQRLRGQRL
jgi:hypothetical protein